MELPLIRQVQLLFLKEIKSEWKQRHALNGIILQLVAAVFIAYLSLGSLKTQVWNGLFWIILMLTTIQAVARGFLQESQGKMLYLHQMASPQAIILGKIIYNIFMAFILGIACILTYILLLGNEIVHWDIFLATMFLFSAGLSALVGTLSALASKAGSNHLLVPVLSFPLLIPLVLVAVRASKVATGLMNMAGYKDIWVLLLFDVMLVFLSVLLYRFVWRE
jgi:heme exporter protein B